MLEIDGPSLLGPTEAEAVLRSHLQVRPPSSLRDSGSTLLFERDRALDLPWHEIFADIDVATASMTPLKQYFERSWRLSRAPATDAELVALQPHLIWMPGAPTDVYATVTFQTKQEKIKVPPGDRDVPVGVEVKPARVLQGLILKDGYGRHYLCKSSARITAEDFATVEAYEAFWRKKLESVEICFRVADEKAVPDGTTRVEYIDLTPKAIHEAYDELMALQAVDKDLQTAVDAPSQQLLSTALQGLNLEEVDRLQNTITSIRLRRLDLKRRLERLVGKAAELGYLLFLEPQKDLKFPDGTTRPNIQAGQLYQQYQRTYTWTTTVDRVECQARRGLRKLTSFFGIESPEPKRWQESKAHSENIMDVRLVEANDNPLAKRLTELGKSYAVFVFQQTPRGYRTADGTSLRDVMLRCERDETFRKRCAALIPTVETSLSGQRIIVGYNVFLAPLPGINPTALPQLSVHESLSYRMVWQDTHLGEVVNVVNLAPGEARKITVRRTYEQESRFSQKRTSVFDLQERESTDIATEVERQLEHTNSAGWNLSASSSGDVSVPVEGVNVTGSASRSFGYNQSVSSFSKLVTKEVRKASQSINRNLKEEVSTDSQRTTRVASFDEYTSTIANINEGRTLNLMFYRLRNRYQSGLFLDDLQFRVTPSVETIAGSGLRDVRTFEPTDFDGLLEEFSSSRLPFDLNEADELRYGRLVMEKLEHILDTEYAVPAPVAPEPEALRGLGAAGSSGGQPEPMRLLVAFPAADDDTRYASAVEAERRLRDEHRSVGDRAAEEMKTLERKLREAAEAAHEEKRRVLKERLDGLALLGRMIDRQTIDLVAPGLYVEALVGAIPSTEAYSERMREQAIAAKMAEIALTRADAEYRLSLAHRLDGAGANCIVGVMPYVERKTLMLGLKAPLGPGAWSLFVDGKEVGAVPEDQYGGYLLHVGLGDGGTLLEEDTLMAGRIELRDANRGAVVRQVLPESMNHRAFPSEQESESAPCAKAH